MKPLINPLSEKIVLKIAENLPHALLLSGDQGLGLDDIAKYIAKLLKTTAEIILPEKDEKIDLEKGIISIEIMRKLYDNLRTKSPNRRIIIIDYAERMTVQAQNAFLKLLEEPGLNVHFILVCSTTAKLLPTILSRTENIRINKITAEQSVSLLDSLEVTDPTKRSRLLFIASGLPSELKRLSQDDECLESRSAIVRDARGMLQDSTYQKLLIAQKYKDSRADTLTLLSDMAKMLKTNIISNPQTNLLKSSESVIATYKNIEANGNIRLCLAKMIL